MKPRPAIWVSLLAALLVPTLAILGLFTLIDLRTLDAAFWLRGPQPPSPEILIIAIDDESFRQTGLQWPWPRAYLAEIVNGVAAGDPSVIVIDVFLYEPSSDLDGDAALTQAIANAGNVVLANNLLREVRLDLGAETELYNQPIEPFNQAALSLGLANIELDSDGFARRSPFFVVRQFDGLAYFSWPVVATAAHLEVPLPTAVTPSAVTFANQRIPLRSGALDINFVGPPSTFQRIPAYQVPLGDYPPSIYADRIVLIGATSETLRDTYPAPFEGTRRPMPGVEVQANAIHTLLTGQFIRRAPTLAVWLTTFILAVFAVLLTRSPNLIFGLLVAGATMLVVIVMWGFLFVGLNFFFPIAAPLMALAVGFTLPATDRAVTETVTRRRLRQRFELFVPPEVIEEIMTDSNALQGQRTELTILFADIRGFTSLSETLTPEEVVAILNPYLTEMTEIIFKYGGTVDKYEGDAILAFWGAPIPHPDDVMRAVSCALEMRATLHRLRTHWGRETFDVGIGINTGEAFVGTIGSRRRVSYTCIGDAVNLASRVQDLTKELGHPILISESTYAAIDTRIDAQPLGAHTIRGRQQTVTLYAVTGRRTFQTAPTAHQPQPEITS